jgi:hypothetical protein
LRVLGGSAVGGVRSRKKLACPEPPAEVSKPEQAPRDWRKEGERIEKSFLAASTPGEVLREQPV